jgi:ABC-type sugar transport system substrate-binding protein
VKPRILVSLLSEDQEFQILQAEDARKTGARLGFDVDVAFAESHAVVQIQQLFKAIHAPEGERPVAIAVEPATGEGLERVARNAVQAGIGWILVNIRAAYLDELRAAHPDLPLAMVGTDQLEVGRIQGRQCRALRPDGGRVLLVQGPADSTVTQERSEGLRETLGAAFEVRGLNGAWTAASGDKAVMSWLRLKTAETFQPDLVVSQNDAMGAGARRALATHRPDWARVPYLGCDGLPDGGQRLVAEGAFAATVITPSNTGPALELLGRWRETHQAPPREVKLAPASHPPEGQLRPWGVS